jgi:hypothetical protein
MCLWVPVVALSVVRLLCALIDWRSRIGYERAREASIVDVLRAAHPGTTVLDKRADGTVLRIEVPSFQGAGHA